MKAIEYGQKVEVRVLDDAGSTEERTENYHAWELMKPVRVTYRLRHKVKTDKDEMEEYARFNREVGGDNTKFDIEFKVDKKKHENSQCYYVIWCYTQLER